MQAPYDGQSLNRYSYVMNDPEGSVDPTGLVCNDVPGGSCGSPVPVGPAPEPVQIAPVQLTPNTPSRGPGPIIVPANPRLQKLDAFNRSNLQRLAQQAAQGGAGPGASSPAQQAEVRQGGGSDCPSCHGVPYASPNRPTDPRAAAIAEAVGPTLPFLLIPEADAAALEEAIAAGEAARGGAAAVRVGQAGEAAVREAVDIGPKEAIEVAGRFRIPDGLTDEVLSEVKNVKSQSFTRQLRDFAEFAQQKGLRFDLYLRPGTEVSGPLQDAIDRGLINRLDIPR